MKSKDFLNVLIIQTGNVGFNAGLPLTYLRDQVSCIDRNSWIMLQRGKSEDLKFKYYGAGR